MTEACNRLAVNYAFLAVYSHTIIINVCECCVNYIKMLMQLTSISAITVLTMFVYCILSDHTDGTVVQRATNNVDACTQCAYLFFVHTVCLKVETMKEICIHIMTLYITNVNKNVPEMFSLLFFAKVFV